MPSALADRATALLHQLTNRPDASFRPDQLEAIELLVAQRRRILLVQRTGWGKSAVYFIATKLLRDQGAGPTLLVSPLLALMRNQIEAAERMGVRAATINSANKDDWAAVVAQLTAGDIDILLISPERLANVAFRQDVLPEIGRQSGLLVIDEAHCISDWGHDFRPDYRRIVRVLDLLPAGVPVACCTATANDRVVDDVVDQLGDDLVTLRGSLLRDGLALQALSLPSPAHRMAWLAEVIPTLPGSGIVYCLTVRDTELVAAWLRSRDIDAVAYHGASDVGERPGIEAGLLANDIKVVVATSALGMGFDKPDLGFVVHYQSPGSAVAYYQQVGRAGRQLDSSVGVLLAGYEDTDIQDFFITTAFPARDDAEAVVDLLTASDRPLSIAAIEAEVNVRRTRLTTMLKVLEVEGAVEYLAGGGYVRTARPWAYDEDRVERVTALRRAEQQQMLEYVSTGSCRMQFLRRALDEGEVGPCRVCDNCTGVSLDPVIEPAQIAAAREFVRAQPMLIEPRKQWPAGVDGVSGRLGAAANEPGRALGAVGDGGWGELVRRGRHEAGAFDDELVRAAALLIRGWDDAAAATWVTCVPSLRRPDLVPDVAARLAAALDLPFVPAVSRTRPSPPQRQMENSAQQVRNVLGAFAVTGPLPSGPVILVDDVFDSRWTLTVVGVALRDAGVPAVFPFALASAVGS